MNNYPPYDPQATDPDDMSLDASAPSRWFPRRAPQEWLTGADYPSLDTRALYVPSHNPHALAIDEYQQYASISQEIPKHHVSDEVLSPLPLGGMQQLHEFHDRVTPPTPPVPEPSYPPAQLAYCGTRTSLASSQSSSSLPYSPYSPTHLSLPGSYDSPSLHVPSLYPSPNQHSLSGYLASPVVGTPSTYYSFYDSPAASSVTNYHSLPTSPALQIGSAFASPAQAGPSALPNDPGPISQFRPSPPRPLVPAVLTRRPVPQLYRIRPNSPLTERFTVDGAPGVSVLGVLKKSVTVDEPSERVLREIYMRQIHLFVSWPGYETKGIYIKLTQNGGHTTRGELVERLCSRLAAIMRAFAKTERDRSESIPYRPTPWAVGRNGMTIDNLWLLAIGPQSQVDARRPWAVELEVHE